MPGDDRASRSRPIGIGRPPRHRLRSSARLALAGRPRCGCRDQSGDQDESPRGDGPAFAPPLEKLAAYYAHLADLARGYEKDGAKLEENLRQVYGWRIR